MAKGTNVRTKSVFRITVAVAIILTAGIIAAGIGTAVKKELDSRPKFITVKKGDNLLIPYADVKYGPNFIPVKYDGHKIGLIAYRDRDGIIRTSFDASAKCYDSGKGYYEYDGEDFVCQNCGEHCSGDYIGYNLDDACVPYPIIERVRFDTPDTVVISDETVEKFLYLFDDWNKYN